MKLRNALLSISLTGLCFSQVVAQDSPRPEPRRIGDGMVQERGDVRSISHEVKSIGDEEVFVEDADFDEAIVPTNFTAVLQDSFITPAAASYISSCESGCSSCGTASCGGTCSPDCESGSSSRWFSAEALIWFSDNHDAPPLVATAAPGVLPVIGNAVNLPFGGNDGISHAVLPGFRVEAGMWLDETEILGLSGRAYGIIEDKEEYQGTGANGTPSIGIPFFNTGLFNQVPAAFAGALAPTEDAFLISFAANGPPVTLVTEGDVWGRSDIDMIGAEASLRVLLGESSDHRVEFIGGYTFNKLKSSIQLVTNSVNRFTGDIITDGTTFMTNDIFEADNDFHGGHVGLSSRISRGGLSLTTLSKVSFGNVRQTTNVFGYTITTPPPAGPASATLGGIFAQPSNIGTYTSDVFAFIPELGVKMGYEVQPGLDLTLGYTFMFWSSVAMAGEQIDRNIDLTDISIPPPTAGLVDGTFWMQGIDLGMQFSF